MINRRILTAFDTVMSTDPHKYPGKPFLLLQCRKTRSVRQIWYNYLVSAMLA